MATAASTLADGASLDVGTSSVNLGNALINGMLKLEITNMTADSDVYEGGQINADTLTLGSNSALLLTIAPNLLGKNASTGPLNLVNVSGETTGDLASLFLNNRYRATIDENGKFIIANYIPVEDIIKDAGGSDNNVETGVTWDEMVVPSDTPAAQVQNTLNELSQHDAKGYVKALTDLAPTDTMIHVAITEEFNKLIDSHTTERLDVEGMNSGDVFERQGAWVKTLYNRSKQEKTSDNQGFKADTTGIALGIDGKINESMTEGVGYAYGRTDADFLGRETDVKAHSIYGYAKYQPNLWYLRGLLSLGTA